jgi:hypothetical protein
MTPKALARILQNRATRAGRVQHVSALQESMTGDNGTCFYVNTNDGGILRVNVTQYKEPLF